jgi:hypothetical protein
VRTLMITSLVVSGMLTTACSITPATSPREYLDEQTAATITVVAEPWIFTRSGETVQLDSLNLYAIDVNRMGDHRKYLVVARYWPDRAAGNANAPTLQLQSSQADVTLQAATDNARTLGIGQPIDASAPASTRYWFYPIDRAQLQSLASSSKLTAVLIDGEFRADYTQWRDGSAQLSEFAATAPGR